MTSATKFTVEVNGKLVTDATVGIADQLEINLVSLTGDDGAVLAVTAFVPGAPKRDSYVHTKNTVLAPGDTVKIALEAATETALTKIAASKEGSDEPTPAGASMTCSFCGKTSVEA